MPDSTRVQDLVSVGVWSNGDPWTPLRLRLELELELETIIRLWALDRLHAEEHGSGGDVNDRLARLEQAVFQQSA